MKDLGQKLYSDRSYNFSRVFVQHLMFKCSGDEVLLHCKVIFNESSYTATLCVSYRQLNELLLANHDAELRREVSALVGEALSMRDLKKMQTSFQINLMKVFERPLRVRGCTYHTKLVMLPLEELVAEPECAYVFVVRRMTFQKALR